MTPSLVKNLSGMTGTDPEIWGLSQDGSVLVGTVETGAGRVVFRWESGIMTTVGDLPGGVYESLATAMTPDGAVIVGLGNDAIGTAPFYWNVAGGIRPIEELLTTEAGLDLTGWQLLSVADLSNDGLTLTGNGRHLGSDVGYRAHLGSSTAVPGVAGSAIARVLLATGLALGAILGQRRAAFGLLVHCARSHRQYRP
jgi:hypothetical protein